MRYSPIHDDWWISILPLDKSESFPGWFCLLAKELKYCIRQFGSPCESFFNAAVFIIDCVLFQIDLHSSQHDHMHNIPNSKCQINTLNNRSRHVSVYVDVASEIKNLHLDYFLRTVLKYLNLNLWKVSEVSNDFGCQNKFIHSSFNPFYMKVYTHSLTIHPSIHSIPSIYCPVHLYIHRSIHWPIDPSIHLSIY